MAVGRRNVLQFVSTGVLSAVAGCSAFNSDSTSTTTDADRNRTFTSFDNGEAIAASNCSKGEPVQPDWTALGPGPIDGFRLQIAPHEIAMGQSFEVFLENVTQTEQESGARKKFDMQHRSQRGWQSIYAKNMGALDHLVPHSPGEGFTWEFTASKDGLSHTTGRFPEYYVCGSITPGDYRFVYWGVDGKDGALAHPFRIE